jgi:hypothetical protein
MFNANKDELLSGSDLLLLGCWQLDLKFVEMEFILQITWH